MEYQTNGKISFINDGRQLVTREATIIYYLIYLTFLMNERIHCLT